MTKILLIKFRHIGDVLLSTPLVSNLKRHYPKSKIDFAINSECSDMLSNHPDINNIIKYDRKLIKAKPTFSKILAEWKFIKTIRNQKYDIVINLTEGERGATLTYFSKAKYKYGFRVRKGIFSKFNIFDGVADDMLNIHTVNKDLQFLKLLELETLEKKVQLHWPKEVESQVTQLLNSNNIDNYVVVHPVSRWMFKCWEDDCMASIIDTFATKGYSVIITGGPDQKEHDRIENIIFLCQSKPLNLAGRINLKQLGFLLSKAKLFFGIDSAPMHMAAAVNTKVIALFGASNITRWGPWDNFDEFTYTEENGIQSSKLHSVFVNTDHTILYEEGVKKSQGMMNIDTQTVMDHI